MRILYIGADMARYIIITSPYNLNAISIEFISMTYCIHIDEGKNESKRA